MAEKGDVDPAVSAIMRGFAAMRLPHPQACARCGREFPAKGRGRYCSATCRTAAWRDRRRAAQQEAPE